MNLTGQIPSHGDCHSPLQERHAVPLPLTQGYSTAFHPSCSAQVAKQLYQLSPETYLNPSSALSYFLRLLVYIITTRRLTMICKGIVSRNNSFPHKKDQYPPAFCLLGKADLYALSIQHIFMSLRKPVAGALTFGAQWTAGKAAGVSLVLKNKWNPRAEEAENWDLCILLLRIYFSSDRDLKESWRQFWLFLIWGRRNGQYNVYCSLVLSCNIDT